MSQAAAVAARRRGDTLAERGVVGASAGAKARYAAAWQARGCVIMD